MTTVKAKTASAAEQRPSNAAHQSLRLIERPANLTPSNAPGFGSDVVADTLRALEIPYIALNPGASYRGLHDSIVNYLGNETPQMLLCLHEESAVAIAHGFAKVTGKAMAAAVHSNVGLFHATMAMFNAWCDRAPVIVLGATGPVDAAKRRPWIDWIHTARDQGAIVRNYTKWDDQPASPGSAREALIRAAWIANTAPKGPVYINLDAEMQEAKLAEPLAPLEAARFMPQADPTVSADLTETAAGMLRAAKHPMILMGRVSRSEAAWNERVALAETLNARVISDLKIGCGFPTNHPLHAGAPASNAMVPEAIDAMKKADVILALDWVDLGGGLRQAFGHEVPKAKIINVSADFQIHNGWSMDYEMLPPVDLLLPATPDQVVGKLLAVLGGAKAPKSVPQAAKTEKYEPSGGPLRVDDLARSLKAAVGNRSATLTHLPLSWNGATWPFLHPLDYIGSEGGGGVGGGPGVSVGAALALKGSGRLPIAICGDGDFCMGVTAIWTAVHYRIPLLFVVCNNRSFFNDELHQERVARIRSRPPENRWIGQRISDPDIDCAALGHAQGAVGFPPVQKTGDLLPTFAQAIAAVEEGHVAVVDVRVEPGYSAVATAAMMRGTEN